MEAVSVDVGFGYVKAIYPTFHRKIAFPAAIAPVHDALLAAFGQRSNVVRINQQPYLVGHAALDAGAQTSWDEKSGVRRDYPLLVAAALHMLQVPAGSIRLYVGLPLSHYTPYREALKTRLKNVSVYVENRLYQFADVLVLPQAVGAYAATMEDEPELRHRPVGVVDVGYRTTDYLIVRHDATRQAHPTLWGTAEVGGQSVAATMVRILAQQGTPLTLSQVERALETGQNLWYKGQEIPLPLNEARSAVATAIANAVQHAWRDELDTLAAIIVTGGAGQALAPFLPWPHVVVPKDPVYANARGYLILAERG